MCQRSPSSDAPKITESTLCIPLSLERPSSLKKILSAKFPTVRDIEILVCCQVELSKAVADISSKRRNDGTHIHLFISYLLLRSLRSAVARLIIAESYRFSNTGEGCGNFQLQTRIPTRLANIYAPNPIIQRSPLRHSGIQHSAFN